MSEAGKVFTLYKRSGPANPCSPQPPDRPSNQKPKVCPRTAAIIAVRAPVAQWIERRPPEPSRLSVAATRVGPRAKQVESYALTEPPSGLVEEEELVPPALGRQFLASLADDNRKVCHGIGQANTRRPATTVISGSTVQAAKAITTARFNPGRPAPAVPAARAAHAREPRGMTHRAQGSLGPRVRDRSRQRRGRSPGRAAWNRVLEGVRCDGKQVGIVSGQEPEDINGKSRWPW